MEVRGRKIQTVSSLLIGGLLGAGVVFLFAPQSGKKTRRDLRHFGKKMINKSEAIGMDMCHSLDRMMDGVSEKLQDGVEHGRDLTERTKRDVQSAIKSSKAYLHGGLQKLRRAS